MKLKESKRPNPGYGFGPQSVNLFHYIILNTKLLVNAAYSCQFYNFGGFGFNSR